MGNQKTSNSEDVSKSPEHSLRNDTDKHDNSRFTRRRLLQAGVATSPLLLSVKSPVSWAGGGLEACSISALGSINASNVSNDNCSNGPLSPGYWHGVFKLQNTTKSDVYDEIVRRGANTSTRFNDTFLTSSVINYINTFNSTNSNWKVSLSSNSPNYDFGWILNGGPNNKLSLYLKFNNKLDKREVIVDVTANVPNVHKFVVCGYLNTLFPGIIDYLTPSELMDLFVTALSQSANSIIGQLDSSNQSSKSRKKSSDNLSYNYSSLEYLVSRSGLQRW